MVSCVVAFVAGAGLLQLQSELPPPSGAWIIVTLAAGALAMLRAGRVWICVAGRFTMYLALAAAGFFWAALLAQMRLTDALPHEWEGQDLVVTGVVASMPQRFDRGVRFEFDVESASPPEAKVPARISLAWYGSWRRVPTSVAAPEVRAGERWELTVRLKRPHGLANPHGFDFEAWLLERGIRASGYVRLGGAHRRIDTLVHRPGYWTERAREQLRGRIQAAVPDAPYAGVLVALAVGDQRAIPAAQWTVFTRTGVNHLMSISGLHVTMVSGLVFASVLALWRRSARLVLALAARRAAALAGVAAAAAYAALAGFAVPAQRTVYMLAVVAAALWLARATSGPVVLAAALLLVVFIDPWAVLSPGFWLSFGAVALIMLVSLGRIGRPHWLASWARTQWAVTLGLIPLLLALFQQVSVVSPLANAFAIPIVSLGVVPLTLLGAVLPFDFVLELAHRLMSVTMVCLDWLAASPDAVWQQHAPPPLSVALAVFGIVWLLLPRGFPGRWVGACALAPLFLALPPPVAHGEAEVAVLDVGQGLAVVIRTRNHALLYDAGPAYSQDADSGSRVVVPFMRAIGVRRLDGIVVTHADNDHAGGAQSVLAALPTQWMASSLPDSSAIHGAARSSAPCLAGQAWEWDGVRFEMLHPALSSYSVERMKANDRSCVLRLATTGASMLLTGDIEVRSERELVERSRFALASDLLVAPHHGSRTSSSPEFLDAVSPRVAIFTVGYRNRFGHPRPDVVARYRDRDIGILRSDQHGAVRVALKRDGWTLTAHRQQAHRYWQQKPDHPGVILDDI